MCHTLAVNIFPQPQQQQQQLSPHKQRKNLNFQTKGNFPGVGGRTKLRKVAATRRTACDWSHSVPPHPTFRSASIVLFCAPPSLSALEFSISPNFDYQNLCFCVCVCVCVCVSFGFVIIFVLVASVDIVYHLGHLFPLSSTSRTMSCPLPRRIACHNCHHRFSLSSTRKFATLERCLRRRRRQTLVTL